jgi:hypothetical protein
MCIPVAVKKEDIRHAGELLKRCHDEREFPEPKQSREIGEGGHAIRIRMAEGVEIWEREDDDHPGSKPAPVWCIGTCDSGDMPRYERNAHETVGSYAQLMKTTNVVFIPKSPATGTRSHLVLDAACCLLQCLHVIPREWVLQGIFGQSPGVALLICRDIFS